MICLSVSVQVFICGTCSLSSIQIILYSLQFSSRKYSPIILCGEKPAVYDLTFSSGSFIKFYSANVKTVSNIIRRTSFITVTTYLRLSCEPRINYVPFFTPLGQAGLSVNVLLAIIRLRRYFASFIVYVLFYYSRWNVRYFSTAKRQFNIVRKNNTFLID